MKAQVTLSIWTRLFAKQQPRVAEVAKNLVAHSSRQRNTSETGKTFETGITQVILGALAFSDPLVLKIQKIRYRICYRCLYNKDGLMVEGWKTAADMTVTTQMKNSLAWCPPFPYNQLKMACLMVQI
jgi:phosphoribosylformimino-5-aminoimidazole carboxamide ribonucleotide (ProFAR) isomerase